MSLQNSGEATSQQFKRSKKVKLNVISCHDSCNFSYNVICRLFINNANPHSIAKTNKVFVGQEVPVDRVF